MERCFLNIYVAELTRYDTSINDKYTLVRF